LLQLKCNTAIWSVATQQFERSVVAEISKWE